MNNELRASTGSATHLFPYLGISSERSGLRIPHFPRKLNKKILQLAIPSIAANITTPLLALVDTAIVGHMGSELYIAAIAVGGLMFNMLYWLFSFLRAGTSGLSAQAYGAADQKAISLTLRRSLLVALTIGALMILLRNPLFDLLIDFTGADSEAGELASVYFHILIFGAPAVLGNYALSGWFLGMQNSKMLLWVSLIINVVNITASLILVYVLHMGVAGVASGTLIAQIVGFGAGFLFMGRYKVVRVKLAEVLRFSELKRFFQVNIDVMLRTVCLIAVTVWFTRAGAKQGNIILSVNALLMQLFMLFSYLMDGFAFAGEALIGRFIGGRQMSDMHLCVRRLLQMGICVALIFTLLYFFGGEAFLRILSDDSDVIAASRDYSLWAVSIPLAGFAAFVWDGVYIGATMTRQLLISMLLSAASFFLIYFLLFPRWGNHALWLAFITYLLLRGLLQSLLFRRAYPRHTSGQ